MLAGARDLLEEVMGCWLLSAVGLRNEPDKRTHVGDAESICRLVEHGREAQWLDEAPGEAGLKLSAATSDILGASCRDMLGVLVP